MSYFVRYVLLVLSVAALAGCHHLHHADMVPAVPSPSPSPSASAIASPAPTATAAPTATPVSIAPSLVFGSVPSANAGTAFASPQPIAFTVNGTYPAAVTIVDADTSGATALSVNGGAPATTVQLHAASDVLAISYSGLAIAPIALSASATGFASVATTFAPTLAPIVYTGPQTNGAPEVDLYAASGLGSSATFSLAEAGFSNAPYSQTFALSVPSTCANIATVTPNGGGTYTVTVAASPSNGICSISLADGLHAPENVTLTLSISTLGVQ